VYSKPAGTTAVSGTTISSANYNATVDDFVTDANTARPVVAGGTGATSATAARTNLGVAIGSDVQAYGASLASLSALGTTANRGLYTTAANTFAEFVFTPFARTLLDDTTADAARDTLAVGDGFLATAGSAGTDLDDIDESGAYQTSTTATNLPGASEVHALWHCQVSANLAGQVAIDLSTNALYWRSKAGGTWGDWQDGRPMGIGQTWQDVSGSRVAGTSYQNNTGRPIMAAITMVAASGPQIQVSTDNSTWVTIGGSDSGTNQPFSFIVPPAHWYRATISYGTWVELR
jgi:hypothetical protein